MADINISVDPTTDVFTITLDKWEWTALYHKVGRNWVPVAQNPSGSAAQFQYSQVGPVSFKAVANTNIVIVNQPSPMFMAGPSNQHTYAAFLSYTTSPSEVHLLGLLESFDELLPDSQPSPMTFSQGRMTGTFQVAG